MNFSHLIQWVAPSARLVIPSRKSWEWLCESRAAFFLEHMRAALEGVHTVELWSEVYTRDEDGATFSMECPAGMSDQMWTNQGLTVTDLMARIYGKEADNYSLAIQKISHHASAPWDDEDGNHPHRAEGGIAGTFQWPVFTSPGQGGGDARE